MTPGPQSDETEVKELARYTDATVHHTAAVLEMSQRLLTVAALLEKDRRRSLWSILRSAIADRLVGPSRDAVVERRRSIREYPLSARDALRNVAEATDDVTATANVVIEKADKMIALIEDSRAEDREARVQASNIQGKIYAWVKRNKGWAAAIGMIFAAIFGWLVNYLGLSPDGGTP